MYQSKRFVIAILALFFCVMPGCVAKEAVKVDMQALRNDMGSLRKIVEQKADNSVVAEQIDEVNNKIEQITQIAKELSIWRDKIIKAETINYGGAGWVVVGTGAIALIFVGAGFLLIRAFMKRGNLLNLLTCAVQKVGKNQPQVQEAIKNQLDEEINNGGKFREQDKKELAQFCRRVGTFFKNV